MIADSAATSPAPVHETEVLVVGGGPAGAATALALARAGCACALVESQTTPKWKIGETMAPESRQLLQRLGVEPALASAGHLPSPGICSAWGSDEAVENDFIFNPHGGAWQLDRPRFEAMLLASAASAGARVWPGVRYQEVRRSAGGWEVTTAGATFRARWLVDATGRPSVVARQLGASRPFFDKLIAIYVLVPSALNGSADARTWIESCSDGWWYSALTPGGSRLISFQTDADLFQAQPARTNTWFWERVNGTRHLRELLSYSHELRDLVPRLTSAQSSRLEPCSGDGWVAVGDAAQSYDPLSGQGLFHALFTGEAAATALCRARSGETAALADYAALSRSLWDRFISHRRATYALERRWLQSPFWSRRQTIPPPPSFESLDASQPAGSNQGS